MPEIYKILNRINILQIVRVCVINVSSHEPEMRQIYFTGISTTYIQ